MRTVPPSATSTPAVIPPAFLRWRGPFVAFACLTLYGCYSGPIGLDEGEAETPQTASKGDDPLPSDAGEPRDEGGSSDPSTSGGDEIGDSGFDDEGPAGDTGGTFGPGPTDGDDSDSGASDSDPGASDSDSGASDSDSGAGDSESGGSAGTDVPDNAYCRDLADWDPQWSALEQQILEIVNQRRAEGANCGSAGQFGPAGPLTMAPGLRCAARFHSRDMVMRGFFDHNSPSGESPGDRIDAAGYEWRTWGENIAAGNATAAATMQQWMDSDGHCRNLMNSSFTEIGVGYYPGGGYGHYWTQAFGAPR